jgi:murein DD-endopeptidase MepM/ murein hydrolase activator NlpD
MTVRESHLGDHTIVLSFLCAALIIVAVATCSLNYAQGKELVQAHNVIEDLKNQIDEKEDEIQDLEEESVYLLALDPLVGLVSDDDIKLLMELIPRGNPLTEVFRVTSSFGESTGFAPREEHTGTDISPKDPENMSWTIMAYAPGEVVSFGVDRALGKNITIEHSPRIRTRYGHLSKIYYTGTTGNLVDENTRIGVMGSTGYSTAAHLHFEILIKTNEGKWVPVDPGPYLINEEMN